MANFLWLIDRGKITKLEFLIRTDKELQKYTADRIKVCLGSGAGEAEQIERQPPPPNLPSSQDEILKQLAASIAIQNESTKETNVLSKMEYDRKISKEKDSKDKIGKLHSSVRHQFLMAASTDGEDKASELPKSCKNFFDQDSAALSDQELSFQLENLGAQDISFGHGTIQAILAGNLLYNAPLNPSNLSLFCFYEKIQDGSDQTNRLLLHVMAKDGRTRSKDEIQKSLKQVVVTPTNYTEMKDQLSIFVFVTGILGRTKLKGIGGGRDLLKGLQTQLFL